MAGWRVRLAACVVSTVATGCPTGLLVAPTADTIGRGAFSGEVQIDGNLGVVRPDSLLLNSEFGLGSRWEVGVDLDCQRHAPTPLVCNAKWNALRSADGRYGVAVGGYGAGARLRPSWYAVGSVDLRAARLHAGPLLVDRKIDWFVGADKTLGRLTLMADHTTGADGCTSVGGMYQFTPQFGLQPGVLFANGGHDTDFTLHFVCCGSY